ncbi:hypothetical protein [Kitasatospora sp. NPDC050543]|uniref:hypothetical protein n=1 Tax=Kitasatospora sp. NPDC050543 TaxID=3364054 RepID=UPI0037B1CED3
MAGKHSLAAELPHSADFGITLLDVTLRDGGYANGHAWTPEEAESVVRAADEGGLHWTEVGYYRPATGDALRPPSSWCPDGYLKRLAACLTGTRMAVMAHPGQVTAADVGRLPGLGVGMLRLPVRPDNLPQALELVREARAVGLESCLNIIRVSELPDAELERMVAAVAGSGVSALYIADSNSSLFPEQVAELIGRCVRAAPMPVGFHAHDGLSLAFANSLAALRAGARYLDASMGGIGKGGGNLVAELIAPYLKLHHGLPLRLQPLTRATAAVVQGWLTTDSAARASSVVHGLLDHNLDAIAASARDSAGGDLISLFDRASEPSHVSLKSLT